MWLWFRGVSYNQPTKILIKEKLTSTKKYIIRKHQKDRAVTPWWPLPSNNARNVFWLTLVLLANTATIWNTLFWLVNDPRLRFFIKPLPSKEVCLIGERDIQPAVKGKPLSCRPLPLHIILFCNFLSIYKGVFANFQYCL